MLIYRRKLIFLQPERLVKRRRILPSDGSRAFCGWNEFERFVSNLILFNWRFYNMRNIIEIKEIKEIKCIKKANDLLRSNWELLAVNRRLSGSFIYCVGKKQANSHIGKSGLVRRQELEATQGNS